MAALYYVAPSDCLSFNKPEEHPKWIRHFEHLRIASGLTEKGEETQVNTTHLHNRG